MVWCFPSVGCNWKWFWNYSPEHNINIKNLWKLSLPFFNWFFFSTSFSIRFIYGPKSSSPNLTSCDQQPDMRCPLLGPRVQFLVKRRHHPVSEGGGLGAGNVRRVFRGSVGLATTVKIWRSLVVQAEWSNHVCKGSALRWVSSLNLNKYHLGMLLLCIET